MEYKLEIQGQSWSQGATLEGELSSKSHGEPPSEKPRLLLAYGLAKKVKTKAPDAFESPLEVHSSEGKFSLPLPSEAPITDKFGSLYLLVGRGEDLSQYGALALDISPHPLVLAFLNRIKVEFRFAEKYMKRKKDWIEVKFTPPGGSEFAKVDQLVLQLRVHEGNLEVEYTFNVQVIDAEAEGISLTKKKLKFSQVYEPKDYQRGQYYNDQAINNGLAEIFLTL